MFAVGCSMCQGGQTVDGARGTVLEDGGHGGVGTGTIFAAVSTLVEAASTRQVAFILNSLLICALCIVQSEGDGLCGEILVLR